MVQIDRISSDDFDWAAEDGPAAEVRRVARASTAHDGATTLNEQAVLQLKHRGLRDADLWVGGGGFALRHGDILDLAVHPESRRQGAGTALAAAALPAGRKVEAWSHADHPGAAALAARFGIPRERELKIMKKSLVDDLGPVTAPDGITIRGFEPADEQALLEVNASAFAHHPEQGHMTHEDFRERTSESWFDPAGLLLAVPTESDSDLPPLLGFHWTKVHTDEDPPYGEVYVVAVNPKAAGRGLGTVLTAAGLRVPQGPRPRLGAALRRRRQRPGDRRLHRTGLRRGPHRGAVPRHLQRRQLTARNHSPGQPREPPRVGGPLLDVVRVPGVRRDVPDEQARESGETELVGGPVVEDPQPRLDDPLVEHPAEAALAREVGRDVLLERVAVREDPRHRQEDAGRPEARIAERRARPGRASRAPSWARATRACA